MGNYIYYRNPRNQLNQVLAVFSIFIGYLAFTDFGCYLSTTSEQAYWWVKAAFPWMLVASFFIHIALLSTENQIIKKKITYVIIYLPSILLALINLTTLEITQGVQRGLYGWTYLPSDSIFYSLTLSWTASLAFLSGALLIVYFLKSSGIKRQQAKYIFLGVSLPIILALLNEFILPALSIKAPSVLNLFMTLGIAFLVYGIGKFKLPQLSSSFISDKILSTMSNFLFLVDENRKIVQINLKALEITGYTEKELIGQPLDFIMPQIDDTDSYSVPLDNIETVIIRKDKGEVPVIVSTSLIKKKKDDILGLVLVGSDLTKLKKTEAERDRYREHLEELVRERTRKLEETNVKLKKEIAAHRKAKKELKDSLNEKDILVKEIHHRVKNNLMIISSLLNLQSHYLTDEKSLNIFKESENRAKSMALIHERLYSNKDMRKIEFDEYLSTLATELFESYSLDPDIKLNLKLDKAMLDVNTAIPLALIVNELITNSFKHAFLEGKGELSIKFRRLPGEDEYELIVKDDGPGFPEDLDFRKADSLGMQLVNNLIKQLNGTVNLDRSQGTKFTIHFKEPKI